MPDIVRNKKWPTNSQLAKCAQEFTDGYDQDFIGCAVKGYDPYIREGLVVPRRDTIFFYYPTVRSITGRHGFLFCTSGIISQDFVMPRYFVSWLAFVTGELLPLGEEDLFSRLCDSLGILRTLCKADDRPNAVRIHQFFSELQSFMRTRFDLKEIMKPQEAASVDGLTDAQLARSARVFLTDYDQTLVRKLACKNTRKRIGYLGIPAGEEIYLQYGGGTAGKERGGFAVTAGGFYCDTETRPVWTDWRTFFASLLEIEGAYVYPDSYTVFRCGGSGGSRVPIVRLPFCHMDTTAADVCALTVHLQDHLRKLYA